MADEMLDLNKSYRGQKKKDIETICEQVSRKSILKAMMSMTDYTGGSQIPDT